MCAPCDTLDYCELPLIHKTRKRSHRTVLLCCVPLCFHHRQVCSALYGLDHQPLMLHFSQEPILNINDQMLKRRGFELNDQDSETYSFVHYIIRTYHRKRRWLASNQLVPRNCFSGGNHACRWLLHWRIRLQCLLYEMLSSELVEHNVFEPQAASVVQMHAH